MADWHGYIGIEDLGLTATQRADILAAIAALGPGSASQPAHLNHYATRLDLMARIYEALFDDNTLTIPSVKQFLADAVGINPAVIAHAVTSQSYAGGTTTIVTFSVSGINRLRMALFGGSGATWAQSRAEAHGYLVANWAAWNPEG